MIPILDRLKNYGDHGRKVGIRGHDVNLLLGSVDSMLDFLPQIDLPAIREPLSVEREFLTHQSLRKFVQDFSLSNFGIPYDSRVAILLPNGAELATCIICVISRYCAAPMNPTSSWMELKAELESTKAVAAIILAGASNNENILKATNDLGIGALVLTPSPTTSGLFRISQLLAPKIQIYIPISDSNPSLKTIMLLHTSGTSGNKKLVPYSLQMIAVGVGCIISSWNLTSNDICLNMMPLFHIGGIVRNILSPILSGGSVITCSGFDPILFWDILYGNETFTWYYAAPTMHHAILGEASKRPRPLPVTTIRYLANAAGGLLPSLAKELRDTFQAVVLTSYGMTECMPISSPPQTYDLNPSGTSGTPVGPDILIVDDNMNQLPKSTNGNILVRGLPCFRKF